MGKKIILPTPYFWEEKPKQIMKEGEREGDSPTRHGAPTGSGVLYWCFT